MRWTSESHTTWWDRVGQWHPWFAWFPVRIGEQRVWLEWIERRLESGYAGIWSIYRFKGQGDKP